MFPKSIFVFLPDLHLILDIFSGKYRRATEIRTIKYAYVGDALYGLAEYGSHFKIFVMKFITVSGPPSSGKTAVLVKVLEELKSQYIHVGVVKFDCLSTNDQEIFHRRGIEAGTGLSGNLCPDHYFVSNVEECIQWGRKKGFDLMVTESAGLCNRCSPHLKGVLAVCVIDNLMGVNTPQKIGPMLKFADIVVITKGDIVSQAEREVFAYRVKQVNPSATILHVNGITGQGAWQLSQLFQQTGVTESFLGTKVRFSMPAALCSYCLGEIRVGEEYQIGNAKKVKFEQGKRSF